MNSEQPDPPPSEEISKKIAEFEEKLKDCQAQHGPEDPSLADILDEYAAFLRANHIKALEAANLAARSRVIRGTKGQAAQLVEELSFNEREADDRGARAVLSICGVLLLTFIGSVGLMILSINADSRAKQLEVEKAARAGTFQLTPESNRRNMESRDRLSRPNAREPGSSIYLTEILNKGKTNVLYFHSGKCIYCQQMSPLVQNLAGARPDLKIHLIEIDRPEADDIDFDSPAARQFDIHSVPKFRIYDDRGNFVSTDADAKQQVKTWMQLSGIVR